MGKRRLIIAAGLCILFFSAHAGAAETENSCVSCHRDIPRDTFIGSKYTDWEGSIHAGQGIACQRCHGGNPSAVKKEDAHAGIYNSGNPLSRVYYKSVPGTCGACHRRDFNAFRESTHYSILQRTGAGPTCATCHESHTTRIVSPRQIPTICRQCHNERMNISPQVPVRAQALLLLINETGYLVRDVRGRIASDDQEGMQTWKDAYEAMQNARDEWHAFNLERVQMKILQVYDMILRFLEKKE